MEPTSLHHKKNALIVLFIIFLSSISCLYLFENKYIIVISGLVILCLPYIMPFVIFGSLSNAKRYFDPLWIKISALIVFSIYIALSTSWSSTMVNNSFSVPSSNFQITTALINIAYFPYNFFGGILNYLMLSVSVFLVFFAVLTPLMQGKQTIKYIFYSITLAIYIGVSSSSVAFMVRNSDYIIKNLAVKLDFDSKNNCVGFDKENFKVVHIGNGNVMVYDSNIYMNDKNQFKISQCINKS